MALNPGASASLFLEAPSGLASLPLADEGSIGYRAASHGGVGENAVLGLWVGGRDGATRAHRPGLPPVPLPGPVASWASPLGVALPPFAWIERVCAEVWRVTHRTP